MNYEKTMIMKKKLKHAFYRLPQENQSEFVKRAFEAVGLIEKDVTIRMNYSTIIFEYNENKIK